MLDRARSDDSRLIGLRRAPLEEQIDVFRRQLRLAAEQNRAASIHCLDAFGPLYDVLQTTPRPERGFLLHAYSGSAELARSFEKLGAYFSFNGAFLDPRKSKLQAVYANISADRLLIESDAPAMALPAEFLNLGSATASPVFNLPVSPEGEVLNHPANIVRTYSALAELRQTDVPSLARQVAENFDRLFGVDRAQ
jgi:TatD DNase family protein